MNEIDFFQLVDITSMTSHVMAASVFLEHHSLLMYPLLLNLDNLQVRSKSEILNNFYLFINL